MWPVILILAIVPMIFFWSDSIRDLFPQLQEYLPAKSSTAHVVNRDTDALPAELQAGAVPGRWYISQTAKGYVAWVMSADGQYRASVGCHTGARATLQVTHLSGATLPDRLHLNYQYGVLPLTNGYSVGAELVGSVAQFHDIYLQSEAKEVIAQFTVPAVDSNAVARTIESACAQPDTVQPPSQL